MVEIARVDPRLIETVANGMERESRIVLGAREAFLLRGRRDAPVDHEGGGAIVIKRGDISEDARGHQNSV